MSTFNAATLFTISPDEISVEKRALLACSQVAVLHIEKGREGWKHPADKARDRDTVNFHQIDPSRGSSMVAPAASVTRAVVKGNPYPEGEAVSEADTSDTWKPYQRIPAMVWDTLRQSADPVTSAQLAAQIATMDHGAPARWFDLTVSDTLRDLRIMGLAVANSAKPNAKRTLWQAVDPTTVPLSEKGQEAVGTATKAPAKRAPRKPAAK